LTAPLLSSRPATFPLAPLTNLLAALLLGAAAWLAVLNLQGAVAARALIDRISAAEHSAETLLATLTDAETGQRGYLLTGDPSYLEPYNAAHARAAADLARLDAAPLGNEPRLVRVERIRDLANAKLEELAATVALRRSGHPEGALAMVETNHGKQTMDRIRVETAYLQADAEIRLVAVRSRVNSVGDWAGVGGLAAASCALLAWAAQQRRAARRNAQGAAELERFIRAFGVSPGMIRARDGTITFWSQGCERLYGYSSEQALGRISHVLLQTRFPRPLRELEATLQSGGEWHGELLHRRSDGSELRVASHWLLHRNLDAGADAVIEVNSDLTSLRRADTLLRSIIEAAPALIYAKDRAGRFLLANPPVLDLIGKPWADVANRTIRDFLSDPAQADALMEFDRQVMDQARGEQMEELIGLDEGGARVWTSVKAPMRDGEGDVTGIVTVSVEITTQKRVEENLRLQAVQLAQAHADLEEFSYTAAHDLKAPLRAIFLLADWIADDIRPTASRETLENLSLMRHRADRLAMLLDGLLRYNRVGHDAAPAEMVDIGQLVSDIAESLAPPPDFVVRFSGEALVVSTPRSPLEHVLRNLIANAIKHHDRPAGDIAVSARPIEGGTEFTVADDGPGIAPEYHKRIFAIFQTLGNRDDNESGGVGLSIVRKTVQRNGGLVWVESAPPARGTRFVFTWPSKSEEEPHSVELKREVIMQDS
jgi:PAS domain S-box-containing protein